MENFFIVALSEKERDTIYTMIENEINCDIDVVSDTTGKDKEFWKKEVLFLKDLKLKFIPIDEKKEARADLIRKYENPIMD